MEEEARDKKRLEKKAREKEAAYQERLRTWEGRERRKAKEYEKERERERCRDEEREREAKRLKEFLEDYDDERDDSKFYKGSELQRRLSARVREAESDARERRREHDELEQLRDHMLASHPPHEADSAFHKAKEELEAQYRPRLIIDASLDASSQRETEMRRQQQRNQDREKAARDRERRLRMRASRQLPADAEPIDSDTSGGSPRSMTPPRAPHTPQSSPGATPPRPPSYAASPASDQPSSAAEEVCAAPTLTISLTRSPSRGDGSKMRRVHAAFADDDEPRHTHAPVVKEKKEKEPKSKKEKSEPEAENKEKEKEKDKDKEGGGKSAEEKRRHIKTLIDKIPTQKDALFQYKLDTSQIDGGLMQKKIRPWINKKMIEYIGEPEPALVDFICSRLAGGAGPEHILRDVQMVLDEEAEVFVVKMWRLLIYELEAKRAGLAK